MNYSEATLPLQLIRKQNSKAKVIPVSQLTSVSYMPRQIQFQFQYFIDTWRGLFRPMRHGIIDIP